MEEMFNMFRQERKLCPMPPNENDNYPKAKIK
jgi:hypothetical protein